MTGSFLEAILEGINPAMKVKRHDIARRIKAPDHGRTATFGIPERISMIMLIGRSNNTVTINPRDPEMKPMIRLSAVKTFLISRLEAPMERRIPISLVLSNTEIYVMIPIIIDETIREMATKAIRT